MRFQRRFPSSSHASNENLGHIKDAETKQMTAKRIASQSRLHNGAVLPLQNLGVCQLQWDSENRSKTPKIRT
ncbi:hypothetical protein E4U55_000347 [Claviceps digitariae]|nr:hypothetical protein E4U55_000347 [Claviceps digitariae]